MIQRYQPPQRPDPAHQRPAAPPDGPRMVLMPVAPPRLTYLLLGIIGVIGLYTFSLGFEGRMLFFADWAKVNEFIRDGEYYRLLTSMFLHVDLPHLMFNGFALLMLGRDVEALFGTPRFALTYFLGGLSGALASFIFTQNASVGASGAIFALFGAEVVYFYQHRDLHGQMGRQHLQQLLFIILINLALGFASTIGEGTYRIDIAGHIGGLVGGLILAWFIAPAYRVHADYAANGGLRVVDENPIQRWMLPSILYTVGLAALIVYAVTA